MIVILLINAAWSGKRVLFASKNNKAVDVVEARVNGIGARPVLIRMGANLYSTKLAEYLIGLLSSTTQEDDKTQYQFAFYQHQKLNNELLNLESEIKLLIDARNTTDQLDQAIADIRKKLSSKLFEQFRLLDIAATKEQIAVVRRALKGADKAQQGIITQLFWSVIGSSRLDEFIKVWRGFEAQAGALEFSIAASLEKIFEAKKYEAVLLDFENHLAVVEPLKKYFQALDQLQKARSLEVITADKIKVLDKIADASDDLWKLWLKLQPAKLNQNDRRLLSQYSTLLKMVIEAGAEGNLEKAVARQYKALFDKVSHLMPCWASTSLSVKKRVPFEAGFFDLVVFDEASQCDIASALPLLFRAKAAVVIGDPKQLSHISGLKKGQDQQLLEKYGLLSNYSHWAYSYNSLFDLAAGLVTRDNFVNLLDHHRSHADIIEFSNKEFYQGDLRVATRYNALKQVNKKDPGIRWIDTKGRVRRPSGSSAVNDKEVQAVVDALEDLLVKRNYQGTVGVVSPFRAQANAIAASAAANVKLSEALNRAEFLADTVHKFQGDERDVMFFSPVVSEGITRGGLGFLGSNGNLFNVAITRARAQLIVVGDLAACATCEIDYLSNFAKYTQQLQRNEGESLPFDLNSDLGARYPAVPNPEMVSDWEKFFYAALYDAGIKSFPQFPVEKFRLDLAILQGDRRLNIEVDGERYHRNYTGELCKRDQMRNQRMYELGWDVMRFWVYEIRDDLPGCIKRIKHWINEAKSSS